jgi:nickel-type superoxide dismutase maturation protease
MIPALRPGDWLLVKSPPTLAPGTVVLAHRPDRRQLLVIKRLERRCTGGWWLLGDNEGFSDDSRTFGPVPTELIVASVLFRYGPPSRGFGRVAP